MNENSIGYILLDYVDGTEGELHREGEREIKNNRSLVSLIYSGNDEKKTRNEFTLNLPHLILRGFPKRSLFKRAKVFFFEAKGNENEKEKNLKGHPERKSERSGKRERKKSVTYVPGIFRGVASPHPRNPKGPVASFLAALRSRCGAKGVIRAN